MKSNLVANFQRFTCCLVGFISTSLGGDKNVDANSMNLRRSVPIHGDDLGLLHLDRGGMLQHSSFHVTPILDSIFFVYLKASTIQDTQKERKQLDIST